MKNSFTIIELLVVIAIIAILSATLAPAIMTAWSKSYVNKAKAEMPGLANIGTMIKLDTGYYVMLADFNNPDGSKPTKGYDITGADKTYATLDITPTDAQWDGPYTAFQSGEVTTSTTTNGSFTADDLPTGTPKDPWGVPYGMCWDGEADAKVMIIYCAGPDGTFDTLPGASSEADDDLIHKYK